VLGELLFFFCCVFYKHRVNFDELMLKKYISNVRLAGWLAHPTRSPFSALDMASTFLWRRSTRGYSQTPFLMPPAPQRIRVELGHQMHFEFKT